MLASPCGPCSRCSGVDRALSDSRLAVRSRGGLRCARKRQVSLPEGALEALSALSTSKLYVTDWPQALHPQVLFPQRAIVANSIGSEGTEFHCLDAIAERGGPEWVPWLEQMAFAGKMNWRFALAASVGCAGSIPTWGQPHVDIFLEPNPGRCALRRRADKT